MSLQVNPNDPILLAGVPPALAPPPTSESPAPPRTDGFEHGGEDDDASGGGPTHLSLPGGSSIPVNGAIAQRPSPSPGPSPPPPAGPDFDATAAEQGWSAAYGQPFVDGMRIISERRSEVFRDLTGRGPFEVTGDDRRTESGEPAGQTSIPHGPGGRVHMQVRTKDESGEDRSAVSQAKDVMHEYTHAKLYHDLGVTQREVNGAGGRERTDLGKLLSHVEESLAYKKGNDLYLESGGDRANIQNLLARQRREQAQVEMLKGIQAGGVPNHGDYERFQRMGMSRDEVDAAWDKMSGQYNRLDAHEEARLKQFIRYHDAQMQGDGSSSSAA